MNQGKSAEDQYDPFVRGPLPVGVRTLEATDQARGRRFPCEVWYPASAEHAGRDLTPETQDEFAIPQLGTSRRQAAVRDAASEPGTRPLVLFSHSSGGGRRQSTFLCTHLGSHGYVVAALDHSEAIAPELARAADETREQIVARQQAWMANRVPDIRFLLDHLLDPAVIPAGIPGLSLDTTRIGIVGHSFGGWTALATPDVEKRIRAVVALAPAGSSQTKPGILPAKLSFAWGREVPTMYLVGEGDVSLPLSGMRELFERTPATKRMLVLRRADHMHFMDGVEQLHEAVRSMPFPGDLAWLPDEMLPISELCTGEHAQLFTRGLTLAHLDATLGQREPARQFLDGAIETELNQHGIDGFVHNP